MAEGRANCIDGRAAPSPAAAATSIVETSAREGILERDSGESMAPGVATKRPPPPPARKGQGASPLCAPAAVGVAGVMNGAITEDVLLLAVPPAPTPAADTEEANGEKGVEGEKRTPFTSCICDGPVPEPAKSPLRRWGPGVWSAALPPLRGETVPVAAAAEGEATLELDIPPSPLTLVSRCRFEWMSPRRATRLLEGRGAAVGFGVPLGDCSVSIDATAPEAEVGGAFGVAVEVEPVRNRIDILLGVAFAAALASPGSLEVSASVEADLSLIDLRFPMVGTLLESAAPTAVPSCLLLSAVVEAPSGDRPPLLLSVDAPDFDAPTVAVAASSSRPMSELRLVCTRREESNRDSRRESVEVLPLAFASACSLERPPPSTSASMLFVG